MIEIWAIPPQEVRKAVWFLQHLVRRALTARPEVPIDQLVTECQSNTAVLWVARKNGEPVAVCFTRNLRPVIEVTLAGGEGYDWAIPLRDRLREYRRAEGCLMSVLVGRRGWGRVAGLGLPVGRREDGLWIFEDAG